MRPILFFVIAACAAWTQTATYADPAKELHSLFEEYWEFEMQEDPFSATSAGYYELNSKVPKVAPQDFQRRLKSRKTMLAQGKRY